MLKGKSIQIDLHISSPECAWSILSKILKSTRKAGLHLTNEILKTLFMKVWGYTGYRYL